MMSQFGCSVPYGDNIENICTDQNKSNLAMKFFTQLKSKRFITKDCPYPCKFTKIFSNIKRKLDVKKKSALSLFFSKFISLSKARYAYGGLELLAEFGGYVGLFLGISVFSLSEAFEKLVKIIVKP